MKKRDLIRKLSAFNVLDLYLLDGKFERGKYTLREINGQWDFIGVDELGEIDYIESFPSEKEAYLGIYRYAKKWNEIYDRANKEAIKRAKYTKIIETKAYGEGFVMTGTKEVYDPPKDKD